PDLDLAAEQAKILDTLKAFEPPPSVIIFSGGGHQGFWRLDTPISVKDAAHIEKLEAYNIGLEQTLGGDHCHNIDRIMRPPGTINLPNEKKRSAGRVPALAELILFKDRVYTLDDFKPAKGPGANAGKNRTETKAGKSKSKTDTDTGFDKTRSGVAFR